MHARDSTATSKCMPHAWFDPIPLTDISTFLLYVSPPYRHFKEHGCENFELMEQPNAAESSSSVLLGE